MNEETSEQELSDEEQIETLDIGEQPSEDSQQPFTLRDRERRREFARYYIAVILLLVFAITVVWVLYAAFYGSETAWENTKEALQVLLPVEASLLGSAVSFYFPLATTVGLGEINVRGGNLGKIYNNNRGRN